MNCRHAFLHLFSSVTDIKSRWCPIVCLRYATSIAIVLYHYRNPLKIGEYCSCWLLLDRIPRRNYLVPYYCKNIYHHHTPLKTKLYYRLQLLSSLLKMLNSCSSNWLTWSDLSTPNSVFGQIRRWRIFIYIPETIWSNSKIGYVRKLRSSLQMAQGAVAGGSNSKSPDQSLHSLTYLQTRMHAVYK